MADEPLPHKIPRRSFADLRYHRGEHTFIIPLQRHGTRRGAFLVSRHPGALSPRRELLRLGLRFGGAGLLS
jgi:hypothetical protein